MTKFWLGLLVLISLVQAQTAVTTTSIVGSPIRYDTYGRQEQNQTVKITTTNYEVDTFWNRFFNPADKKKIFSEVSTTGTATITVEASSACSIAGKGELAAAGCSGQKPFLVNDASVAGLVDGGSVSLTFQPVFQDGDHPLGYYTSTSADKMIYPLDIQRDEDYYKNDVPLGAKKSFFGFFGDIFKIFFSFFGFSSSDSTNYQNSLVVKVDNITSADAERQRYKANIIAGVQQKYLMPTGTNLHQGLLNTPVSLLHYLQKDKVTSVSSCQTSGWTSILCRMMSGFTSLFFNTTLLSKNTSGSSVKSEIITLDTENALLALAGKVAPTKVQTKATSTPTTLTSGMFSWMTNMMNMMFGTITAAATTPVYTETNYQFTDSEAMTMTLPITKDAGSTVDRFETYKLMGIHSTNAAQGTGDETCTVEKKEATTSFFFFPSGTSVSSETFYKSKGTTTTTMTLSSGFMSTMNTHNEWTDWCRPKSVGYSVSAGGFFTASATYTITAKNSGGIGLGRGLVLDLKKVTLDPGDPLNTTEFKLINVTH